MNRKYNAMEMTVVASDKDKKLSPTTWWSRLVDLNFLRNIQIFHIFIYLYDFWAILKRRWEF